MNNHWSTGNIIFDSTSIGRHHHFPGTFFISKILNFQVVWPIWENFRVKWKYFKLFTCVWRSAGGLLIQVNLNRKINYMTWHTSNVNIFICVNTVNIHITIRWWHSSFFSRVPKVKLKIPGKLLLNPNPELLLHSSYSFWPWLSISGSGWDLASLLPWKKCEKYKKSFPGIFNFTVGILIREHIWWSIQNIWNRVDFRWVLPYRNAKIEMFLRALITLNFFWSWKSRRPFFSCSWNITTHRFNIFHSLYPF